MSTRTTGSFLKGITCTLGLAAVCLAGCQSSIGGQTLPSPHYLSDDVQYFAPGTEFKLSREAEKLKRLNAEQQLP